MDKLATKKQLARIVQMFASNQLPFDATQEFIVAHSKKQQKLLKKTDDHLVFWEARYPGKGKQLLDVLRPFYCWEPRLKPVLSNLRELAAEAIFWRELAGVISYSDTDSECGQAPELWGDLIDIGLNVGWELEWSRYHGSGDRLRRDLRLAFQDELSSAEIPEGEPLICDLLVHCCAWVLAGNDSMVERIRRVLDLCLAGNFPIGFDVEGNLLVLVAD